MKIELTQKQLNDIWKKLTPDEALDLLGLTPNASIDIVRRFIYLHVHQPWQKKIIQEALDSAPTEIELFPEQNNP